MGKQTSKLKPNNFTELAQQTDFQQEDLVEWYKGFVKAYPNQALTIEDFKKIYGHHFPFGDATQFAQHVFRQLDRNGDGSIDFREFIVWLSVTLSGTADERLRRVFAMYDLDGDGSVSRDEMTEMVRSIYRMVGIGNESNAGRRVDEIFDKLDADVDGLLSLEEFIEGTQKDPTVMKLLQCDWEMRLLTNFGTANNASVSASEGDAKPHLCTQMSVPLPPKCSLSKKMSVPVGMTSSHVTSSHKPLNKRLSTPVISSSHIPEMTPRKTEDIKFHDDT